MHKKLGSILFLPSSLKNSCSACFDEANSASRLGVDKLDRNCPPSKRQDRVRTLFNSISRMKPSHVFEQVFLASFDFHLSPPHFSPTTMPSTAHSPTFLIITVELSVRIDKHLFRGAVQFVLQPGALLHPHLTLLQVCKKIYIEARVSATESVKLHLFTVNSSRIPQEVRDA